MILPGIKESDTYEAPVLAALSRTFIVDFLFLASTR